MPSTTTTTTPTATAKAQNSGASKASAPPSVTRKRLVSGTKGLGRVGLGVITVPPLPNARFTLAGKSYTTDGTGAFVIPGTDLSRSGQKTLSRRVVSQRLTMERLHRSDGGQFRLERYFTKVGSEHGHPVLRAAINAYVPVQFDFRDRFGKAANLRLLDAMTIKRSDGAVITLKRNRLHKSTVLLQASRVVSLSGGLVSKALQYRIQSVTVGGNNLVNRAQQAFTPLQKPHVAVRLLFYSARVSARDTIFGFGIGSGVRLEYPDGRVEHHAFADGHELIFEALPRGEYHLSVEAPGLSGSQPVSITRDQVVQLKVLSYLDIGFGLLVVASVAVGLLVFGRGRARRAPDRSPADPTPPPLPAVQPPQTTPSPAQQGDGA